MSSALLCKAQFTGLRFHRRDAFWVAEEDIVSINRSKDRFRAKTKRFRGGGFLVLLQLFSALILRLFSAYSPHSKAAAHGALLSRGTAERRLLRRTHAIEVSDRFKLPIPV